MEKIEFLVQGSAAAPYEVVFARENNEVTALCSCAAGENGTYCKHRIDILDGVLKGVVSDNAQRVREVLSWLPGSSLQACLTELTSATRAVEQARLVEVQARKKLAAAMRGKANQSAEKKTMPTTPADKSSASVVHPYPSLGESVKRQRVPLTSVEFTDNKGEVKGYAKGWYFWIHSSFQDALDIRSVTTIDKKRTAILRNKKSLELFGVTHDELKRNIEAAGKKLGGSKEHNQIMKYTVSEGGHLSESTDPQYEFRVTDGIESRTGDWYVQVDQTAETDGAPGSIGFKLYTRNHTALPNEGIWTRRTWLSTTQRDFVTLLRTGRCSVIDLEDPPEFDIAQETN